MTMSTRPQGDPPVELLVIVSNLTTTLAALLALHAKVIVGPKQAEEQRRRRVNDLLYRLDATIIDADSILQKLALLIDQLGVGELDMRDSGVAPGSVIQAKTGDRLLADSQRAVRETRSVCTSLSEELDREDKQRARALTSDLQRLEIGIWLSYDRFLASFDEALQKTYGFVRDLGGKYDFDPRPRNITFVDRGS